MELVIMAAGMGSRFGGLKQIEPVGPNGEFIIDYSRVSKRLAGQQSLGSDDELDNDEEDNKNKTIDSESEEEHEKLPLIHENETITSKNTKL